MNVITSNIVAGFVECTLYGIFILLSSFALVLLYRRHRLRNATLGPTESTLPPLLRWIAQLWKLRKAPLVVATFLLIISVTAVSPAD